MAEGSYPGSSGSITDVNYEKLMAAIAADGVIGTPADSAVVYGDGSGLNVKIRADKFAVVRGELWTSGAVEFSKSIAANGSGSTRVDRVVLRLDHADRDTTVEVVQGTAGAGLPALTQDTGTSGVWELPLARVTITSGDTAIGAGDVAADAYYVGEATVVCTSTTRPPHAPGLRIWETDTGRSLISTGTSWTTTVDDSGWLNLAAASGWSVNGTAKYRRLNDMVTVVAAFTRTGATLPAGASNDSTLATLPADYRPSVAQRALGYINGAYLAVVTINTSGTVVLTDYFQNGVGNGQAVQIQSVTFPV